jgi:endonuclease YncB( thermonuclease family)
MTQRGWLAAVAAFLAAVASAIVFAAPDAGATTATAQIVAVRDGDSVTMKVPGRGTIGVHLIGINAPLGSCTADQAKLKLEGLLQPNDVVKIKGDLNAPVDSYGEIHLRVFTTSGKEAVRSLLKKGLGVAMPDSGATSWANTHYRKWEQVGQDRGRNLWKPNKCGTGPTQAADLRLRVRWDADGPDDSTLSGEWVEVINVGSKAVNLGGWRLSDATDSTDHTYSFPSTTLQPGQKIRIVGGPGSGHWGNTSQLFGQVGDGAYLFDPDTDIRAYFEFPCLTDCTDPLIGKVSVLAHYDPAGPDSEDINGEWIDVTNVSNGSIDLYDHFLRNGIYTYLFDGPTVLQKGQYLRLHVGTGNDGARAWGIERYWGKDHPILNNDADTVELLGLDGTPVAAHTWPCTDCAPAPQVDIVFADPGGDLNGGAEWIDLHNPTGSTVDLSGWQVTVGAKEYIFPSGVDVPADGRIRVDFGRGTDTSTVVHWGLTTTTLWDVTDEVQLKSPYGDVVSCYGWGGSSCDRPTDLGPFRMIVNYDADGNSNEETANGEWVHLRNTGATQFSLDGYRIMFEGAVYDLSGITLYQDGDSRDTLTLFAGSGSDSGWKKHWGLPYQNNFPNNPTSPKTMLLFDPDGAVAGEYTWPCGGCSPEADVKLILHDVTGTDWIEVKNPSSTATVSLDDWWIGEGTGGEIPNNHYYFPGGILLGPKASISVFIGPSGTYHWDSVNFDHIGGQNERIALFDPFGVTTWCDAWGTTAPCP